MQGNAHYTDKCFFLKNTAAQDWKHCCGLHWRERPAPGVSCDDAVAKNAEAEALCSIGASDKHQMFQSCGAGTDG